MGVVVEVVLLGLLDVQGVAGEVGGAAGGVGQPRRQVVLARADLGGRGRGSAEP